MSRLIFYIISIIFSLIISAFSQTRGYRGYTRANSDLADSIRARIRRRMALRRCKKFLSRKNKTFILKNQNAVLIFDVKKKTLVCFNAKNIKQAASIEWFNQVISAYEPERDNTFERTFDDICVSFTDNSNFAGILKVLKKNFDNVKEINQDASNDTNIIKHEINIKIPERKDRININDATAEQLSKLPGINIIAAKKIVQRISLKGNYFNLNEMFEEMNIKRHFQLQLEKLICAKPVELKNKKSENSDRIIDL